MPPNLSTLIPPLFQFGYKVKLNKQGSEKSLEVQWLGLGDFTAKDPGSQVWCSQKKKKKEITGSGPQTYFIYLLFKPKVNSNYKGMKR